MGAEKRNIRDDASVGTDRTFGIGIAETADVDLVIELQ